MNYNSQKQGNYFEMNLFLIFAKKCVPEWKQCYYDQVNLKSLIILCKKASSIRFNIEDLTRQDNYPMNEESRLIEYKDILQLIKVNKRSKILAIMSETNILFYKYHSINKRVAFLFCQYKIHQLNARLNKYAEWQPHVVQTKHCLLELLSNCYAQNIKLLIMAQIHLQAYQKIYKSHENAFKLFDLSTPGKRTVRMSITLLDMKRYAQKLQHTLQPYEQIRIRQTKYKLQQQVQPSPFIKSMTSYLFGLFNGFSICLLVSSIVILALDVGKYQLSKDSATMFLNQYRLWTGTGFIILYIWVFALSFYIYEREGINYNLIFNYRSKKQKSTTNLGVATFFALLWTTLFIFYCLNLVGLIKVETFQDSPPLPITIFFPIIIFCTFIIAAALKLIRKRKGVMFFIATILQVLLTPFGFYEVIFGVFWGTEQFFSLVMVFYDVSYSFCYYIHILHIPQTSNNQCFNFIIMVQIISIILFVFQLLKLIRVGIERKKFFCTRQMFRGIRALISITVLACSLASNPQNKSIFWAWFALAIIHGIYSFIIDVFLDWSLFFIQKNKEGKRVLVRRQQNILKISTINFMVCCNFICRFSFLIIICPKVILTYVGSPQLVLVISQALQMCRRLIWNVLRVENEQVKNNYFFQIRTNYQSNQKKIMKQLESKKIKYSKPEQIENKRALMELETLRDSIRQKNKWKQLIAGFYKRNNKFLDQLEIEAENEIIKIMGKIL